jgi:hypothetical protein
VDDAIEEAVKKIGFQISGITDNSLVIDVNDPEIENPAILKAIEAAGGHVQFVTEIGSTLEDVYLKLVRE